MIAMGFLFSVAIVAFAITYSSKKFT